MRVIISNESKTAKANGEIEGNVSRFDHEGTKVLVKGGVTSKTIDAKLTKMLIIDPQKDAGNSMSKTYSRIKKYNEKNKKINLI